MFLRGYSPPAVTGKKLTNSNSKDWLEGRKHPGSQTIFYGAALSS